MLKVNRFNKTDPYFMLNKDQKNLAQKIVGELNEISEEVDQENFVTNSSMQPSILPN